jgi:hypothetical protein
VDERADDVVLVDELPARVEPEDRRDGRQAQQPRVRRAHPAAEPVGEAQHARLHVGARGREVGDEVLGLDDVALDPRARRVRALHVLAEERRVVLLGAVVVGARLEHEPAHGRVLAAARGEDVHRADDVVLVGAARARHGRVDDHPRVDDGVDLGALDDAADEAVRIGDLHELRALQGDLRRAAVDADDRVDLGVCLERLRQAPAPVGR